MKREELTELHFITPIENLPSILKYGIQSHRRAEVGRKRKLIDPVSIAMPEVQDRREGVTIPGGRALHEYANLYICARNPMMFKRKDEHESLCVLRISPGVLDIKGVVITDMNAASSHKRFASAPKGLEIVDREMVFADDWRHEDQLDYWRHKAVKCAEVLVPGEVRPVYIFGVYVSCSRAASRVEEVEAPLQVTVNPHLFFV